ncbi:DcaP family trimeric outer membrane transporter [Marinobacterium maritimum]|uniref:DcaP family trimeric outer membrane transporter n=1 Tax=Marinobacterium maritimum TaxID=500162 RepID=A0ABN1I4Q1_9GAMM
MSMYKIKKIQALTSILAIGVASHASAVSFNVGDYEASVYGYVRLNMAYDFDESIGGGAQNGLFPKLNDSGSTGEFNATANQSRIGVSIKKENGPKVVVEGDFYTGTMRLRHAYGEYKGLLAGQYWSNYNSFVASTPTLDFNGLVGVPGLQHREPQLRYTNGKFSVSIEDPRSGFNSANGAALKQSSPAFTARYESRANGGGVSFGALAKQNTHDNGVSDDSTFAYAVFGAGKVAIAENVSIQGSINYSDGANKYLYQSYADDAYLDASGSLQNITGYAGQLGATFKLDGGDRINLGVGMAKVDWDDAVADGIAVNSKSELNRNIIINYQWTPVKDVMFGVEVSNWYKEKVDGTDTSANRLMFAAQYNF